MVESRWRIYFCHGRREVKMGSSNLSYLYMPQRKMNQIYGFPYLTILSTDPGSIAICWICKPNWALFVASVMLQMLNSTSLANTKMLHLFTNLAHKNNTHCRVSWYIPCCIWSHVMVHRNMTQPSILCSLIWSQKKLMYGFVSGCSDNRTVSHWKIKFGVVTMNQRALRSSPSAGWWRRMI